MSTQKETKIHTENKGTQVAPKQTPAEKEAAKKTEKESDPAGAPPPMEILKKGKPAEEGAPVKSGAAEADLNKQNSEETTNDPAQTRQPGNDPGKAEYGKGL